MGFVPAANMVATACLAEVENLVDAAYLAEDIQAVAGFAAEPALAVGDIRAVGFVLAAGMVAAAYLVESACLAVAAYLVQERLGELG